MATTRFNRRELLGIGVSIILLLLVLGVIRFYPTWQTPESASEESPDIVYVGVDEQNKDALARAIVEGSDSNGHVIKLIVDDLTVGTGREVKIGDTVTVHYIGVLKDGPEFDNSYKEGTPFSFKVGAGEVIKGWDTGIIGMKEGGKRILVVPPALGYGNTPVNNLPANATLIFSLNLLSIQ